MEEDTDVCVVFHVIVLDIVTHINEFEKNYERR